MEYAGIATLGIIAAAANLLLNVDEKYTIFGELRGRMVVSGITVLGISAVGMLL